MNLLVSGLHSGPNPSPGIGVARSIRDAFPEMHVTGVDYSLGSSGIHEPSFDCIWLQRPWAELDLGLYRNMIGEALKKDGFWISGLDLEVHWLARALHGSERILAPKTSTLKMTSKPTFLGASGLDVDIPAHISADRTDQELHAFCRRYGWPLWCKGPYYEARCAWSWEEVVNFIAELRGTWTLGQPVLQAHVVGREVSIAFSAHRGRLLGCVEMNKHSQTAEGKTWAGRVDEVTGQLRKKLSKTVADLDWSGGGELEFVRGDDGQLHLIDWNPRFPAWIFGATLAGHNLPALLVEAATASRPRPRSATSAEFTRIVTEIPVRPEYPLPPAPPSTTGGRPTGGKHPSGMPDLATRLAGPRHHARTGAAPIPAGLMADLATIGSIVTPRKIILPETANQVFASVADSTINRMNLGVTASVAYSVKTNPDRDLMTLARNSGFMAEVITQAELRYALACGFRPGQIVLNGPAQFWPDEARTAVPLGAVFADSLERLAALADNGVKSRFVGARLRPFPIDSRFGIDLSDVHVFNELVELLRRIPGKLGLHFHVHSELFGSDRWWETYEAVLRWAGTIETEVERPVACLDVGGGWYPQDYMTEFVPKLKETIQRAKQTLVGLEVLLMEPGKALAQPSVALITQVLEVRKGRYTQAVIDAAISDLPMAAAYPHRIYATDARRKLVALPRGDDKLLGRSCMAGDLVAGGVRLPAWLRPGSVLAICDAGAYDSSMSYQFGVGDGSC